METSSHTEVSSVVSDRSDTILETPAFANSCNVLSLFNFWNIVQESQAWMSALRSGLGGEINLSMHKGGVF